MKKSGLIAIAVISAAMSFTVSVGAEVDIETAGRFSGVGLQMETGHETKPIYEYFSANLSRGIKAERYAGVEGQDMEQPEAGELDIETIERLEGTMEPASSVDAVSDQELDIETLERLVGAVKHASLKDAISGQELDVETIERLSGTVADRALEAVIPGGEIDIETIDIMSGKADRNIYSIVSNAFLDHSEIAGG